MNLADARPGTRVCSGHLRGEVLAPGPRGTVIVEWNDGGTTPHQPAVLQAEPEPVRFAMEIPPPPPDPPVDLDAELVIAGHRAGQLAEREAIADYLELRGYVALAVRIRHEEHRGTP